MGVPLFYGPKLHTASSNWNNLNHEVAPRMQQRGYYPVMEVSLLTLIWQNHKFY